MNELRKITAGRRDGEPVELRPARPEDADACGRIIYLAFRRFHESRGFAPDFPSVEFATELARAQLADGDVHGVVAERAGAVVGSNFLMEGDAIRGVGPISVHPDHQGAGIGRLLMQAVIDRAAQARGVRLVQDAFNTASMSLYASLGFDAREPLALLVGRPAATTTPGTSVRPMRASDVGAADDLCRDVHGGARGAEVRSALARGTAVVLERDGALAGYMTVPHLWLLNHAVARSEADLRALILGAAPTDGASISFLMPVRRAELFRWCLAQGFRMQKPMTLMTRGYYSDPRGGYLPSVLY